jgi:capsular exopolysaccharide synthesis family protein
MSKLFRQAQQPKEWTAGQTNAPNTNVQRLLESVRAGETVAAEMADSRLQHCRKFRLTGTAEATLLKHMKDENSAALEAYRALRTRLMRAQSASGLCSILVSSATQGEGKTLTSVNLSLCWAQVPDARILLVDGDLRTRGLTKLLGLPSMVGLADVLAGRAQFADGILATQWPNLYVLNAGNLEGSPAELYSGPRWSEFIGWCSECFKVVLVDAPPILPLADFELMLAACEGLLVVVRALSTQRQDLERAAKLIDTKKLLGVVMNDSDSGPRNRYLAYHSPNQKNKGNSRGQSDESKG